MVIFFQLFEGRIFWEKSSLVMVIYIALTETTLFPIATVRITKYPTKCDKSDIWAIGIYAMFS